MSVEYAYGMWVIVAFNIGLFLFFFVEVYGWYAALIWIPIYTIVFTA